MGHGATLTKARVLDRADQAVEAVNRAVGAVDDLAAEQAALHATLAGADAELAKRVTAISLWCEKLEQDHAKDLEALRSLIAMTIAQNNRDVEGVLGVRFGLVNEAVNTDRDRVDAFIRRMSFPQRLAWLFLGVLPPQYASCAQRPSPGSVRLP